MKVLENKFLFYGIISFLAFAVAVWLYFLAPHKGTYHTNYNDYMLYKQSFEHLFLHKDLYVLYESECNDLYKYTPSFAILMAPFYYMPNFFGVFFWSLLNLILPFYAFRNFPFQNERVKLFAMAFILLEVMTSLIYTQCNCIMAGLMIISFELLEKRNLLLATFVVVLSVFIKPFALLSFVLFLFYPGKGKAIAYSLMWVAIIFLLPLIVISPDGLIGEYKSWLMLLKNDHDVSFGVSFLGVMNSWFGVTQKNVVVAIGLIILLLPLVRYKAFVSQSYRILFLASSLIWVIIFNHKGETPGYILAVTGIAIWYFAQASNKFNLLLLLIALLFTVLEPTDIFPRYVRAHFLVPYVVCVVPCALIWLKITWELMTKDFSLQEIPKNGSLKDSPIQ